MGSVIQLGVYLDNHSTTKEKFNFYAIDILFVEVYYNVTKNKILDIQSFKSGRLLNRYPNIDKFGIE